MEQNEYLKLSNIEERTQVKGVNRTPRYSKYLQKIVTFEKNFQNVLFYHNILISLPRQIN